MLPALSVMCPSPFATMHVDEHKRADAATMRLGPGVVNITVEEVHHGDLVVAHGQCGRGYRGWEEVSGGDLALACRSMWLEDIVCSGCIEACKRLCPQHHGEASSK